MVILDDLHRLVEYVQVGGQITISHSLLHTLTTLLTITPPAGVYICVLVHVWCIGVCGVGVGSVVGIGYMFAAYDYLHKCVCTCTHLFPFPPPLPSSPPLLSSLSLTLTLLHQAQGCWWWEQ